MSIEEECINYIYTKLFFCRMNHLEQPSWEEKKIRFRLGVPAVLLLRPTYPSNSCLYKEKKWGCGLFCKKRTFWFKPRNVHKSLTIPNGIYLESLRHSYFDHFYIFPSLKTPDPKPTFSIRLRNLLDKDRFLQKLGWSSARPQDFQQIAGAARLGW